MKILEFSPLENGDYQELLSSDSLDTDQKMSTCAPRHSGGSQQQT